MDAFTRSEVSRILANTKELLEGLKELRELREEVRQLRQEVATLTGEREKFKTEWIKHFPNVPNYTTADVDLKSEHFRRMFGCPCMDAELRRNKLKGLKDAVRRQDYKWIYYQTYDIECRILQLLWMQAIADGDDCGAKVCRAIIDSELEFRLPFKSFGVITLTECEFTGMVRTLGLSKYHWE